MFYVTFVLKKKLLYIELRVLDRKEKGLEMQERTKKRLLPIGRFGSRQRFSLSRQSFLDLCCDMVLRLQAIAGCDRCFPGSDRVVFLMFFYRDRAPYSIAIVFRFLS